MIDNLGKMSILEVLQSTSAKLRLTLAMCLCWYLFLSGVAGQQTDPVEVNALQSIKRSLIDPHRYLARWNGGDPCSSNWTGVICYNRTLDDGYFHVKELILFDRNLSGSLSPKLGHLSHLKILDFMQNNITGSIPKEIGNITPLELLLLNGNNLTGSLPDELGNLSKLDKIQIDENRLSGPVPRSFANLIKAQHFHMNNNLLNGQIPAELSRLPILVHLLLDNNNLSGPLPPKLSKMPKLQILQLDNNNFGENTIPPSYGVMPNLLKLSLRNCRLRGSIPDWSNSPKLAYIDLSLNHLNGTIPTGALSKNITTIILSGNNLDGTIPASFSRLPRLQKLSVANNSLNGSIPTSIWQNANKNRRLILDFRFNFFSNISGRQQIPPSVSIGLQGNPVCSNSSLDQFCGPHDGDFSNTLNDNVCRPSHNSCLPPYEYVPASPVAHCFCSVPLFVGYRLKSPLFLDFDPYINLFKKHLGSELDMNASQIGIDSLAWQEGPRLAMYVKIFPAYVNNTSLFSSSKIRWIRETFSGWKSPDDESLGPADLLNITLVGPYKEESHPSSSGLSKGALAGIILGTMAGSVTLTAFVCLLIFRRRMQKHHMSSKRRTSTGISVRIDGVKAFTYGEMALATNDFNSSTMIGHGGYGKVHRGVLADGTLVAIKRAQGGSLQGEKEFLTEIELLSRLHHRNLVSLIGYCDEEGEQMLIYEYMPNGNLRHHLSGKSKVPLTFALRVKIALGAARGILYLHTEANPPIFHRDIKATNILLDSKFIAKVADFGLSRLAPVPNLEGDMPSHVSTVVKGTPGYLDPEYFLTHQLTDKSDVYSIGVVFMEMLTGMHPISHGKNIVREVNVAYCSSMIFSIIDEQMGSCPSECVEKFLNLALKCCQEETEGRPSMAEVVRELEGLWLTLPETDTNLTDFLASNSVKVVTPPTSSSSMKNPFISQDVSGNDLISGAIPSITPR